MLPRPETLSQVDFVRLRFVLDFISPCLLNPAVWLGLRQRLRLAGRQTLEGHSKDDLSRWNCLFQPLLSNDPVALRKFQKPAPAFVLQWPFVQERVVDIGERVELEVLLLGTGISSVYDFSRSLIHLGPLGLVDGNGTYEVTEIQSVAADLSSQTVWRKENLFDVFSPNILTLDWWIDTHLPTYDNLTLEFATPTRLLVGGKPLRRPSFKQVFPFLLRRVTSMLHAHCGIEVVDDPAPLLAAAEGVDVVAKALRWYDWRSFSAGQNQALGGIVGQMTLAGPTLEEIDWVLATAALFGTGKGAAYGAGQLRLD